MRVGVVQARFWLEAFWGRPTAACKDEKDKMDSAQQVLSVLVSPEFLSSLGLLLIVQGAYLINKRRAAQRVLFGSANVRLPGGGIKPRTIKHAFRRKREAMTKIKYDESAWFKQISGVNVTQEDTIEGQEFRDAFGIPYFLFMYIVSLCRDREWHRKFTADPRGPKRIPLELLILSVLHVLAKSARCNSVYILRFVLAHTACRDPVVLTTQILKRSGVSAPSVRKFFKVFCRSFAKECYPTWVKLPSTQAEVEEKRRQYAELGLAGGIGSIDATHVGWDRAGSTEKFLFVGKEGFPTLAYQAVVDHLGIIMSWTASFIGSANDMTISMFDASLHRLRTDQLFTEHEYTLYNVHGQPFRMKGVYFICDGGYHKWRVLQEGNKNTPVPGDDHYSDRVASVRKDVEVTFGRYMGCVNLPIICTSTH